MQLYFNDQVGGGAGDHDITNAVNLWEDISASVAHGASALATDNVKMQADASVGTGFVCGVLDGDFNFSAAGVVDTFQGAGTLSGGTLAARVFAVNRTGGALTMQGNAANGSACTYQPLSETGGTMTVSRSGTAPLRVDTLVYADSHGNTFTVVLPDPSLVYTTTHFGANTAGSTGTLTFPTGVWVSTAYGGSYGIDGTSQSPSLAIVSVTDVRHGTQVNNGDGSAHLGTAYIPTAGDVRLGTSVDATTGTLAVPSAADVLNGVAVDAATGTYAAPGDADVRYGVGGGTCHVPTAANTVFGVAVDATTGLAHVPAASDVRSGTAVNQTVGSLAVPAAASVLNGVAVDATTGIYVAVSTANTRSGTTFGAASALTGTLAVPTAANVLFGVSVDAGTGTYHGPAASDVRHGTSVGTTTGTAYIPVANNVRATIAVDTTVGAIVIPANTDVKNGTTYDISTVGTLSGGGTITEGIMIPVASADVVVATGATPTALIDVSTTVSAVAYAVRALSIDVAAPSGCIVTLSVFVRMKASGRLIAAPGLGRVQDFAKDGAHPIPASTNASFLFPMPPGIDSVVVKATHDAAGNKTVTIGGSLA